MQLPDALRTALNQALDAARPGDLVRSATRLSEAYRDGKSPVFGGPTDALAYAAVRMPATYATIYSVLSRLPADFRPDSALDLGSGTGAAAWAIAELFDGCQVDAWERDANLVQLAQQLGADFRLAGAELNSFRHAKRYPLVIASYSLGETGGLASALVDRAWQATSGALVLIEPGTPAGFTKIREWRGQLINQGCHLFAPCPQAGECPVVEPDWCHFSARVERSAWHRRIKGGTLSYEDEKFSYLIASREPWPRAESRVVRHPRYSPGLVELRICTPAGSLRTERVTRRGDYKRARKVVWGDEWGASTSPAGSPSLPQTEPE